jgi:toxin ParE1/3/4
VQVIFTPRAMRQIEDLHSYISQSTRAGVADGYVGRIIQYCERFEVFPLRGTGRDDILPGLRTIGFERRVTIAFVVTPEAVLIEGIFYGGQDFATRLTEP